MFCRVTKFSAYHGRQEKLFYRRILRLSESFFFVDKNFKIINTESNSAIFTKINTYEIYAKTVDDDVLRCCSSMKNTRSAINEGTNPVKYPKSLNCFTFQFLSIPKKVKLGEMNLHKYGDRPFIRILSGDIAIVFIWLLIQIATVGSGLEMHRNLSGECS